MREMDMNTLCRLCLGEKSKLLDVFASHVIQGLTAADTIMELLQIQVSASDAYPHCVCIECLKILEDFKLFKQRCESNKDLLDRAYARKLQVETNEELMGMAVPCDVVIKEECIENPSNEQENAVSTEFEEYVYDSYETSSDKLIESANPVTVPIKCEYEDQTSVETDLVKVPHTLSVKKSNEKIPVVNRPCENILCSDHGEKEEVLDVNEESCCDGSFQEDISWVSVAELTQKVNLNSIISKDETGCSSCMSDHNTSDAQSSGPQNDIGVPIAESRLSRMEDVFGNEDNSIVSNIQNHGNILGDEIPGERRYSCKLCNKWFSEKSNLSRHTRIHSGQMPHSCEQCGKSFSQRDNLNQHLKVHSGERPYGCELCGKSFSQKGSLDSHKRTHTAEKPYSCEQCNKSFSRRDRLTQHMRGHYGDRPHKCNQCSQSFFEKRKLDRHMMTHSGERPYGCELCGKSFSQKGNLDSHKRTHTAEKPYSCEQCNKSFSRRDHLTQHLKVHSGERRYSCDQCDKAFSEKRTLNKHMMRTHSLQ